MSLLGRVRPESVNYKPKTLAQQHLAGQNEERAFKSDAQSRWVELFSLQPKHV